MPKPAFASPGVEQEIAYNQTLGSYLAFTENRVKATAALYYQTGAIRSRNLSAWYAAAELNFGLSEKVAAGIGAEYLSGTDMDSPDTDLNSFTPWFGTNHKFNGWMDYFYAGNHSNSVGLIDVFAQLSYKKEKFNATLKPHLFWSAANIINTTGDVEDMYLGTELDFSLGYQLIKEIGLSAGYSHMFAASSMEILKQGNAENTNNWAWVMLTIKSTLFSSEKKQGNQL